MKAGRRHVAPRWASLDSCVTADVSPLETSGPPQSQSLSKSSYAIIRVLIGTEAGGTPLFSPRMYLDSGLCDLRYSEAFRRASSRRGNPPQRRAFPLLFPPRPWLLSLSPFGRCAAAVLQPPVFAAEKRLRCRELLNLPLMPSATNTHLWPHEDIGRAHTLQHLPTPHLPITRASAPRRGSSTYPTSPLRNGGGQGGGLTPCLLSPLLHA